MLFGVDLHGPVYFGVESFLEDIDLLDEVLVAVVDLLAEVADHGSLYFELLLVVLVVVLLALPVVVPLVLLQVLLKVVLEDRVQQLVICCLGGHYLLDARL